MTVAANSQTILQDGFIKSWLTKSWTEPANVGRHAGHFQISIKTTTSAAPHESCGLQRNTLKFGKEYMQEPEINADIVSRRMHELYLEHSSDIQAIFERDPDMLCVFKVKITVRDYSDDDNFIDIKLYCPVAKEKFLI